MADIDPATAAERARGFLADYLEESGADGYTLGVSGGLDSAVALRLCVDAVGSERVTGLVLPGEPSDSENMADARELCTALGVEFYEAHIDPLVAAVTGSLPHDPETETVGNVRARARMVLLYYEANATGALVVGPDNRSEYLLGYFTKYGDGAADLCPLGDLYKTEVYDLGEHLGLETFVEKTPTAGLWEGQTDEGEIGAAYETIDPILRAVVDDGESVERAAERADTDVDTARELVEMVRRSEHKRTRPPVAEMPGR